MRIGMEHALTLPRNVSNWVTCPISVHVIRPRWIAKLIREPLDMGCIPQYAQSSGLRQAAGSNPAPNARREGRTTMSHHFDTQVAKDDSRLNVLDMYIFEGAAPQTTAMILTTNPDAGIFAPLTLHPEGLYAFRFDTNGDGIADIAFKFVFEEPRHLDGDDSHHEQRFRVLRAVGGELPGHEGELLVEGVVGETVRTARGIQAYVGRAAELWAADAFGFFTVVNGIFVDHRYPTTAFDRKSNLFAGRNNMATVLEVPNSLLGADRVEAWATVSLFGHAPEVQVYRWGLPLFTHLLLSDPRAPELAARFHQTAPWEDSQLFRTAVTNFVQTFADIGGQISHPADYASTLIPRLVPAVLPYQIGSTAEFCTTRFNGRPLASDAFDVMLTVASGTPISDGVAPDVSRIRTEFPYCGIPYDDTEQAGMRPLRELIGLSY